MHKKVLTINILFLYLALLIFIPVLLSFQGLDLTDTGWVLSNYQQIFTDPESVSYWFHLWLTNIAGGLWNLLFKGAGLLSFKFAGVLIFWMTALIVYFLFKDILPKEYLLPALVSGMVFQFAGKITVIHYNNLTTLLLFLGIFLLVKGLRNNSRFLMFLSGFIFALNGFVRLPNILGILFVLIIIYDARANQYNIIHELMNIILFLSGALASIVLILGIMLILGHLPIYLSSVRDLFAGTGDELSHYKSNTIEKKFLYDHARAVLSSMIGLGSFYLLTRILSSEKRLGIKRLFHVMITLFLSAGSYFFFWKEPMMLVYPVVGFTYFTCFLIMITQGKKDHGNKLIAFSVMIAFAILSVGSDTGMKVASYGFLIGFPLIFRFWILVPDLHISYESTLNGILLVHKNISLSQIARREAFIYFLLFYASFSVPLLIRDTYRDTPERWRMSTSISHPLLHGIFTTPERAEVVQGLLSEVSKYTKPGDFLLTFESIPMIHFLTQTRPYAYNPWSILYLPAEFERALNKARLERSKLPLIILATTQTRSSRWPNSGPVSNTETAAKNRKLLYKFLEEYKYKTVWENQAFRVLLPS